jgi:hypothetical protein
VSATTKVGSDEIILAGLAVGATLAVVAVSGDLPMALLTVLIALAGASSSLTGLVLIFGVSLSRTSTRRPPPNVSTMTGGGM